jgi:hypothetical protein
LHRTEAVEDCHLVAENKACGGKEVPASIPNFSVGDKHIASRE